MFNKQFLKPEAHITFRTLTSCHSLLTVKGYARLSVQAAGQRADADAVVVVALRRGQGSSDGSKGLSGRDLRGSVFEFDVPKGRSPELRDGP